MRVLHVDDHEDTSDLLAIWLEREGYAAVSVRNVAAARAALAHERFDVVLTDVNLPDGSGADVVAAARSSASARARCIGVSGVARRGDAPFDDFLQKPVALDDLGRKLAAVARLA